MTTIYTVTECKMETDLSSGFGEAYDEKEHRFATKEEMLAKFDALKTGASLERYPRGSRSIKLATNLATYRYEFSDEEAAQEYLKDGAGNRGPDAKETNMICWEAE